MNYKVLSIITSIVAVVEAVFLTAMIVFLKRPITEAVAKEHDGSKDYALVHDVLNQPSEYLDTAIKITGIYSNSLVQADGTLAEPEEDEVVYHFLTVFDEPKDCYRTIEFVSKDGTYPNFGDEIFVSGTVTLYREGNNQYVTVNDASWLVMTESPLASSSSSTDSEASSSSTDSEASSSSTDSK